MRFLVFVSRCQISIDLGLFLGTRLRWFGFGAVTVATSLRPSQLSLASFTSYEYAKCKGDEGICYILVLLVVPLELWLIER